VKGDVVVLVHAVRPLRAESAPTSTFGPARRDILGRAGRCRGKKTMPSWFRGLNGVVEIGLQD